MDNELIEDDLESGIHSVTSASYQALQDVLEPVNPVARERSAWTNFYTVAGGIIGTGITAPVMWHFAHVAGDEDVDNAMPVVAISGTVLASLGVCCYFLTYGADIFHATVKKIFAKK